MMARELLGLEPRPTAMFAANNAIALGAIAAVGERGLRVPQDVALVCFDDVSPYVTAFPVPDRRRAARIRNGPRGRG